MSRSMPASSANEAHRQDCRRESTKYMIARESIISCLHASYCKIHGYEKFSVKNVKYSPSPSKTQTEGPQSAYQGEIGKCIPCASRFFIKWESVGLQSLGRSVS